MVREEKEIKDDKKYFVCEICGFSYEENEWAQRCQNWCEEHNSCNMEITKRSVQLR